MISGRDGGRAELNLFIYLLARLIVLQEGQRSVFVCSVSTNMFLKVHHGTLKKAPAGGGELPAADGCLLAPLPDECLREARLLLGLRMQPDWCLFDQPPC